MAAPTGYKKVVHPDKIIIAKSNFPEKIRFLSDDTEAEFIKETETGRADYRYTKSKTKICKIVNLKMEDIERLKGYKLLEIF